jgi:O-6-methylguanine DNA methyltransferase
LGVNTCYHIFPTISGWAGILCSDRGLQRLILFSDSAEDVHRKLDIPTRSDNFVPERLSNIIERLKLYFSGYKVDFPDMLDLSGFTAFQVMVWNLTRLIPYGETRSYTWIAEQAGQIRAVRAVGQALGKNPLPIIIPCHRVIAQNGNIGGYAGGIELKRRLIRLESSAFLRDRTSPRRVI